MAKRRKPKPVTVAKFAPVGIEPILTKTVDPYDGRPLAVVKNARVHPLDHLLARQRITDEQKAGGDRFLALFDRAMIGGARAIDYSRAKVDTSYVHRGLDPGMGEAVRELSMIGKEIGRPRYLLLWQLIGERTPVHELGAKIDGCFPSRATTLALYGEIRDALNDLARHFGIGRRRPSIVMPEYERRPIEPYTGKIEVAVVGDKLVLTGA